MKLTRTASILAAAATLGVSVIVCAASDVASIREAAKSAVVRQGELQDQQAKLQTDLNRLAKRIETLKGRRSQNPVVTQELQTELKRSQKLSGQLSDLATALSAAQAEAHRKNESLVSALSQALRDLQRQWTDARDIARRRQLLDQMRSLRAERERVRAQLSLGELPTLLDRASENPEDLMEQADALRDSGDKVQQQIKELRARISDLRTERELDQRMADFAGDEALFDEHDRRVRSRGDSRASAVGPSSFQSTGPTGTPGITGSSPSTGDRTTGGATDLIGRSTIASDGRPEVGVAKPGRESSDLSVLEQKLKQLETLAKELEQRARESEMRAKVLEK